MLYHVDAKAGCKQIAQRTGLKPPPFMPFLIKTRLSVRKLGLKRVHDALGGPPGDIRVLHLRGTVILES